MIVRQWEWCAHQKNEELEFIYVSNKTNQLLFILKLLHML